jgi:hypothetical protein
MAVGDQYRRISPEDQLIFDSTGAVVGIRSGLSTGAEFRGAVSGAGIAVSGAGIAVAASREITADDSGAWLLPVAGVTLTIPAGLNPMPSFTVDCPAAGAVSIARSGAATINGAGTVLTRTRAANPVGFVVLAHADADAYGVSGA